MLTYSRLIGRDATSQASNWLASISTPNATPALPSFLEGLAELGYVEGGNVDFEYRWAEFHPERFPPLAADLVQAQMCQTPIGKPGPMSPASCEGKAPPIYP